MAKGDDAVRRKRNKSNRKRLRNTESAVSARIASIIASKRRRKAGKRRICEGMCFSLPTLDDPFNERHGKKALPEKKSNKPLPQRNTNKQKFSSQTENDPLPAPKAEKENTKKRINSAAICNKQQPAVTAAASKVQLKGKGHGEELDFDNGCPSKFLILCLNAIQDAWMEEGSFDGSLLVNEWGVDFWKCCSTGSNILDTSGDFASREKVAWLVSAASDIVARNEKHGDVLVSPFLLFLVPTQEKAAQVRSICKPLKALGIHTVSLHPGAPLEHQIHGLKSCEPEFLVSTPERLIDLLSLKAIEISGVSLLVIDGLKTFMDLGFVDKLNSLREAISGNPQIVLFCDCYSEMYSEIAENLVRGPVSRLSELETISSQSAFISQHVNFHISEEEKLAKAREIIAQAFSKQRLKYGKILLIAGTASKAQILISSLKDEGYAVSNDGTGEFSFAAVSKEAFQIFVKDRESLQKVDIAEFESVVLIDFPTSIEDYVGILTGMARHAVAGMLHSFFCKADSPLAQPLIEVLLQCAQTVPEVIRSL